MTAARSRIDWRDLDRAKLGEAYNSAAAVPGSAALIASWEPRSAKVRQSAQVELDLAYGPRPRNRLDLFRSSAPRAPTLVFIHGGYWQMRAKESFAFIAGGPLAIGMNVALVGYTLAPAASMDEMVAEIRSGLDWLATSLPALGCDPDRLLLSGWSAGAQLATMTMDHASVRGCLAISGIYDLEPMRHCYVNDKLNLDEAAALRNSPIRQQSAANVPVAIVVGGSELPLMLQQSADYMEARARLGAPTSWCEIRGADHFSILEDIAASDGQIIDILRDLRAAAGL